MKITIDPFDKQSISDAIKQVRQYKKEFLAKEKEFVKRLAEIGVSVASTGFQLADYDGDNDVRVIMQRSGNHATVIAYGETVGFIEFGTGIRNPEWDNTGMMYTPPKHGTYGKKHGARPKGWWFYANDRGIDQNKKKGGKLATHTYGNQPAEAMRTARDEMVGRVIQIAREVWR